MSENARRKKRVKPRTYAKRRRTAMLVGGALIVGKAALGTAAGAAVKAAGKAAGVTMNQKRPSRSRYRRTRIASPAEFDPRSFRTIDPGRPGGHKTVVACPKGQWKGGRCQDGMEVQAVLGPKGNPVFLKRYRLLDKSGRIIAGVAATGPKDALLGIKQQFKREGKRFPRGKTRLVQVATAPLFPAGGAAARYKKGRRPPPGRLVTPGIVGFERAMEKRFGPPVPETKLTWFSAGKRNPQYPEWHPRYGMFMGSYASAEKAKEAGERLREEDHEVWVIKHGKRWLVYAKAIKENPGLDWHLKQRDRYERMLAADVAEEHGAAADYWQGAASAETRGVAASRVGKNPGLRWFIVTLDGEVIDEIPFKGKMSAEEMKRSLIQHDNYDPRIEVEEFKANPLLMVVPNPNVAAQARSIVQEVLKTHGLSNKFTIKKTSFSGLGYGDGYFVTIDDWRPGPMGLTAKLKTSILAELSAIALPSPDDRWVVSFRGPSIAGNPSDRERSMWIDNDEGLYNWWRSSRLSKREFVKQYRAELDEVIRKVTGGEKPAHYLAYPNAPRKTGRTRNNPKSELVISEERMGKHPVFVVRVSDYRADVGTTWTPVKWFKTRKEAEDWLKRGGDLGGPSKNPPVENPDMADLMKHPDFKKGVALYRKIHGCDPESVSRVMLPVGGKRNMGRSVMVALGKAPAESYQIAARDSIKKKGQIYVHKYEGKKPVKAVDVTGKLIVTLPGKHAVKQAAGQDQAWING